MLLKDVGQDTNLDLRSIAQSVIIKQDQEPSFEELVTDIIFPEEQEQIAMAQEVREQATMEQEEQNEQEQVSMAQEVQTQTAIEPKEQEQDSMTQEVQGQATMEIEEQGQVSMVQEVQGQVSMEIEEQEQVLMEIEVQEQAIREQGEQGRVDKTKKLQEQGVMEKEQNVHTSNDLYNKNYCRTRISSSTIDHTWEIDRFSDIIKIGEKVESASFPKTTQQYTLLWKIYTSESEILKHLQLHLSNTRKKFTGLCTVSLSSTSKNIIIKKTLSGLITNNTVLCKIPAFMVNTIKNKLTVKCTIEVFHNLINDTITIRDTGFINRNLETTNFKTLTRNSNSPPDSNLDKKFIEFIVNGESYSMSLNLMHTVNSSYFKNLYNEFQENGMLSPIELNENPFVFNEMLLYLKTGFITEVHNFNTLQDLLMLAHKYDVQELKKLCEQHLIRMTTKENVIRLMKFAILYNAQYLEKFTASFIKFYQQDIMDSTELPLLSQYVLNKVIEAIEKINIDTVVTHEFQC